MRSFSFRFSVISFVYLLFLAAFPQLVFADAQAEFLALQDTVDADFIVFRDAKESFDGHTTVLEHDQASVQSAIMTNVSERFATDHRVELKRIENSLTDADSTSLREQVSSYGVYLDDVATDPTVLDQGTTIAQDSILLAQAPGDSAAPGLNTNNDTNNAEGAVPDDPDTGGGGKVPDDPESPATEKLEVKFQNPIGAESVDGLLTTILRAIQTIVASLAVLFIVIGAVIYLTSAGNASRLELAKNAIWAAIIGLALALAAPSFLAEIYTVLGQGVPTIDGIGPAKSLTEIVLSVLKVLLSFVGVLAVIMLVVGGLIYMLSGGDSGRLETGKKIVVYAIVGLIIALVSLVIVTQIANIFT